MKRDMDLVRVLLLAIEASTGAIHGNQLRQSLERDHDEIEYHLRLLHEAGFLDAHFEPSPNRGSHGWNVRGMTWAGHEFLDSVRDPEIWRKTKQGAAAAGGFTLQLLGDLAKGYLKKQIEEKTGVQL